MTKIPLKPKNYQNTPKIQKKNVKVGKSVFERERERALVQREGGWMIKRCVGFFMFSFK